ncbi:hypothetical protein CEP54_009280 [Fusarium duplospermum]|uniref:Uncharacterized protein n=1 Tax=Fusarium duplospermum TaxID=1325734 RepID=A0A428PR79_9HYPO|nr:hypothetical protein CEP54_009280 [Fusarium duplospermum]
MPSQSTTLRHVLTQEKPCVPCTTEPGRNATYAGWPLNASYGHILDVPIPEGLMDVPRAEQLLAGVSLTKQEHLNYLIEWNDQVLQKALRLAKSHLDLHPGIVLKHEFMAADQSTPIWLPNGPRRAKINHLVRLDDSPGPTCLVVGLQLANACKMAKTRYGCHVLTTDLALWWICMLAMSTHQPRDIVGEAQMANINDWNMVNLGQGRGWVRRHLYSGVEKPTGPPPPPPSSSSY